MKHAPTLVAAVLVAFIQSANGGRPASPPAEDTSPAAMMARIEGRQVPDRQGFDGLTLAQFMERMRVPGVSIAVIKDFEIHWAKGYGIADVDERRAGHDGHDLSGGVDQQADRRDGRACAWCRTASCRWTRTSTRS